jgi:hypothetical protein
MWQTNLQQIPMRRPTVLRLRVGIATLLCMALPVAGLAANANAYKVIYNGGSLTSFKAGSPMKISIGDDAIRLMQDKSEMIVIPSEAVTEISYGQDVHRRIGAAIGVGVVTLGLGALLALAKSKKHFVGLTWDDGTKKGGLAFQVDKSEYRGLLAGMEGFTGKKAVNSDVMTVKN